MQKMQLSKFIANNSNYSRRAAVELIKKGKIQVNREVASIGQKVSNNDIIKIGNKTIKPNSEKIYIIVNKPGGYVCSNRKFKGEDNVFDLLVDKEKNLKQKLFVVGRLDKNSRGLVLLTNDGDLTQQISHPKYRHEKKYEVKILSKTKELPVKEVKNIINSFKQGIDIGEGDGIVKTKKTIFRGKNAFDIILSQGKKRQIRRMFNILGYKVIDIKRTRIGSQANGINLGKLKKGEWRCLKYSEIEKLLKG